MSRIYDALVIGGGAAGLMCSGTAAGRGKRVLLLEKMDSPGRKLLITGKGRCNVTNNCGEDEFIRSVKTNGRFLYSANSAFGPADTMEFFEKLGVPLKTERGKRVFPVSDRSSDIVEALMRFVKDGGVEIENSACKSLLIENGIVAGVSAGDGERLSQKVVVATGGISYPLTGSTGDGYRFATQAGHTVTELRPSLIPVVTAEKWCGELMGLSLKNVRLSLYEKGRKNPVFSELGEMLFTHFGISGPLVLSASAHITGTFADYTLKLDLKPGLSAEQLDARIIRDFTENLNRDFINSLARLLPRKLIPVVVRLSGIPAEIKVNQITKTQRTELVSVLKGLTVTPKAFRPIEEAVVTSGGVRVSEINPKTMESKLVRGLYFAGEVLDVDAYTGGFNLQIAFSTGYLAGMSI